MQPPPHAAILTGDATITTTTNTTSSSPTNHRIIQIQPSPSTYSGIRSYSSNTNPNPNLLTSRYASAPSASGVRRPSLSAGGRGRSESESTASANISLSNLSFAQRAPSTFHRYRRTRSGTVGSIGGRSDATDVVASAELQRLNHYALPSDRVDYHQADESLPAVVAHSPPSPSFFSGSLPRTSSLLPPPSIPVANSININVTAEHDPSLYEPLPTSRRPQSRSSSIGALSDGFRNLNRWSVSTASSRASNRGAPDQDQVYQLQQPPPRQTNFSRRMSVDSVVLFTQATEHLDLPSTESSRKLSKRRPSNLNSTSPPLVARVRQHSPPPLAPPPNLPPIISLPSLDLTALSASSTKSPPLSRPSPAIATPNSVFSSQANSANGGKEPKDYFWDELADPNISPSVATRGTTPALFPPDPIVREGAMPEMQKGHTRNRSSAAKSSSDSTKRDRTKQPSQKAMLSRALAKANAAVQLDNAQNYESARQSYNEACDLLHQVLARTTGEEDKKKLEAIRRTYTSRIEELDDMVPAQSQISKALPARPGSSPYDGVDRRPADGGELNDALAIETAPVTRIGKQDSLNPASQATNSKSPTLTITDYPSSGNLAVYQPQLPLQSGFSKSPLRRNFEGSLAIPHPGDTKYVPAPLSPRRPLSPARVASPEVVVRQDFSMPTERLAPRESLKGHMRNPSHESVSWLDPIDESGGSDGSAASSVHSRTSSYGVRRKHIRASSGDTEAEFDAALDAAVEAAYDEGYEPMDSSEMVYDNDNVDEVVANALRKVELAKERVRQSEREAAIEMAHERERQRMLESEKNLGSQPSNGQFYDGDDSDEEEERMLDEMRTYAMENFSFGQQSRQQPGGARGRESDSSGTTQRTWHSSLGSNPPTATTILSTVTEMPALFSKPAPSLPPPQALPQIPSAQTPNIASSVRSRRLSGQNPKQLKIETSKIGQPPTGLPPATTSAMHTKTGSYIVNQRQALSATTNKPMPFSLRTPGSPSRGISPSPAMAPPTPPQNPPLTEDSDDFRTGSPSSFGAGLRKNQSSSSLKSLKSHQLSITNIDNVSDLSPITPLSHTLTNSSVTRQPTIPALPTPMAATFGGKATGGFGGVFLFDSDFHSPSLHSPSSTHNLAPDAPVPLEPCPADAMLRPFWLMRALYQTLANPRGGYITNRLFIPRDVWKVKGVKLRSLEDKSSQCDLLTAALLKLAKVDSTDADAVLEEMQSLENVLEQVQQTLTRKLGNEVGANGAGAFRDKEDGESAAPVPRTMSVSSKGAPFSWRRLRSKGSAVNLSSAYGGKSSSGGSGSDIIPEKDVTSNGLGSLASLPMVSHASSRPAKRDVTSVKFDGPYAGYMASLARLFDAAQTVDLIARQVEDPGLRHADKTQVGLELCTRQAAEFFAFYICRFVLADLGMLLDKFVKRGSEWVMS